MLSLSKSRSSQGPLDSPKVGPGLEGSSVGKVEYLLAEAAGGGRGASQRNMWDLGGWALGQQHGDWLGPEKTLQVLKGLVSSYLGDGKELWIPCEKTRAGPYRIPSLSLAF